MIHTLIHADSRYPVNRKVIKQTVVETFNKNKLGSLDSEVSVAVVGSRKMRELADKYMPDGKVHEVLAFPFEDVSSRAGSGFINPSDDILRLGEVVVCWPQLIECAREDDMMVDEELAMLISHGVEHLLGKHHE